MASPPDPRAARHPAGARAALAPALAVAGAVVWLFVVGGAFGFVGRGPTPAQNALMVGGLIAGLACHVGAVAVSVRRWRRERRWPVVALLYGVAALGGVAAWGWSLGAEGRYLRDTPGAFVVEESGDGVAVEVRDASGPWRVPLDACPGRGRRASGQTLGTRYRDGGADVSYGDGAYYLRLHVAGRRVECLAPDALSGSLPPALPGV